MHTYAAIFVESKSAALFFGFLMVLSGLYLLFLERQLVVQIEMAAVLRRKVATPFVPKIC